MRARAATEAAAEAVAEATAEVDLAAGAAAAQAGLEAHQRAAAAKVAEQERAAAAAAAQREAHDRLVAARAAASESARAAEQAREQRAAERRARRTQQWDESIKPFIAENVLWFLGGFLIILGSLYFIRLAWGLTGVVGRHLLLVSIALAYAAAFVGVGLWFKRKHNLTTPSRAMAYVGLSLLPVALLETADAFNTSRAVWAVTLPIAVGLAWPIAYLGAGLLARELARPLATAVAAMLALLGLARGAAAVSPLAALALPYAGWLIAHRAASTPLRGAQAPPTAALAFHLSALGYALAFQIGLSRAVSIDGAELPWLTAMGPLAVLVSFSALRVDVELRARWGARPHLDAPLVAAFCLGIAGVAGAARVPVLLALSAALASALFAVSLVWFRRQLLLLFSLAMAGTAWAALVFGRSPVNAVVQDLSGIAAGALSQPLLRQWPAWLFLLLPVAAGAHWLGGRLERRDEGRLASSARRFAWVVLLGACGASFASSDLRTAWTSLLPAAPLLAFWHLRRPRALTAWAATLALGGGVLLLAAVRAELPAPLSASASVLAACGAIALLRPGRRLGAAALLQMALLASLGALALAIGLAPSGAPLAAFAAPLGLVLAVWTVGALAHASVLLGLVAVAAGTLLLWTLLFAGSSSGLTSLLAPFDPLDLRVLIAPAALTAAAWLGRMGARRLRGWPGLPLPLEPLQPRARSLHAISEAALVLAWPSLLAAAAAALGARGVAGPLVLAAVALLSALLARMTRLEAGAAIASAAITLAGALTADLLLGGGAASNRTLAALALGASAGAAAAAIAWDRLPGARSHRSVHEFGRAVGLFGLLLSWAAALVSCWSLLAPLFALRAPGVSLLPGTPAAAPIASAAALGSALAWFSLKKRTEGALAVPLIALAAAVATLVAGLAPSAPGAAATGILWVPAAMAALGVSAAAARLLLLRRIARETAAAPSTEGDAAAQAALAADKTARRQRWSDRDWTLLVFARTCAAIGVATSFLPPGTPFPLWPHAAADVLLLAFLGLSLAASGGPLFLHLLFVALALTASRIRMALGIPTQGHGMVLAAGALLVLGVLLRRKERYAVVALGWALLAAVAAWVRFSVNVAPLGPRLDQWPWALGAALVCIPLAPRLLPRFTATFAAFATSGALLLGLLANRPDWFGGGNNFWMLPCAGLGLGFALLAAPVARSRGLAAQWLAPEEQAEALQQAGALLAAISGTWALLSCWALLSALGGTGLAVAPLAPASPAAALVAAATVVTAVLAWFALRKPAEGALLITLVALGSATLAVVAAFTSVLWVPAAIAAMAVAAAAAGLLLQRRIAQTAAAGQTGHGDAPPTFATDDQRDRREASLLRWSDTEATLVVFARACAALGVATSFLPPGTPFPIWPHAAADVLLLAFLGLSLAAGGGPLFLHLLFVALALTASRIRMALGIPTQGHGMVLAAGALLILGVLLRKRERYANAALGWTLLAAVAAWLRFSVNPAPLGPRLDQWPWALGAALVCIPLAPRLLPRFTATFAAFASAGALLLAALATWPAWFGGAANGWTLCCALLGLGFALIAIPIEKARGFAAQVLAPGEQQQALRQSGALLVAAPGALAVLAASAALLRIQVSGAPPAGQVALIVALAAAGAGALIFRFEESIGRPLEVLATGVALAAALLFSARLGEAFPPAPVLVLLAFALATRGLSRFPALAARMNLATVACWVLAAGATHLATGEWTTAAAVAALAVLVPADLVPKPIRAFAPRTWVLLVAAAFALTWWTSVSPTGAALGVLAPLSILAGAATWFHVLRGRGESSAVIGLGAGAAGLTLFAAIGAQTGTHAAAVLAAGALLVALLVWMAWSGAERSLDLAVAGAVLLFAFWRAAPLPALLAPSSDPTLSLVVALAAIAAERALRERRADLADSLLRTSVAFPLLAVTLAVLRQGSGAVGEIAFGAALCFALLAWLHWTARFSRHAVLLAVFLCNVALFAIWKNRGLSDVQLYTIPLGLSLLVAAQLGRGDLERSNLQVLRGLGCIVLYAGTGWQMATSDGLLFPMLLGLLALATVAGGALLKVRAFLFFGAATLVVDVLANLGRYSFRSQLVLAITITVTGLGLLAGLAWFSVRRAQALEMYRRFSATLEDWE